MRIRTGLWLVVCLLAHREGFARLDPDLLTAPTFAIACDCRRVQTAEELLQGRPARPNEPLVPQPHFASRPDGKQYLVRREISPERYLNQSEIVVQTDLSSRKVAEALLVNYKNEDTAPGCKGMRLPEAVHASVTDSDVRRLFERDATVHSHREAGSVAPVFFRVQVPAPVQMVEETGVLKFCRVLEMRRSGVADFWSEVKDAGSPPELRFQDRFRILGAMMNALGKQPGIGGPAPLPPPQQQQAEPPAPVRSRPGH